MKAACLNLSVSVISADENDIFPFTSLFIGVRKYGRFIMKPGENRRCILIRLMSRIWHCLSVSCRTFWQLKAVRLRTHRSQRMGSSTIFPRFSLGLKGLLWASPLIFILLEAGERKDVRKLVFPFQSASRGNTSWVFVENARFRPIRNGFFDFLHWYWDRFFDSERIFPRIVWFEKHRGALFTGEDIFHRSSSSGDELAGYACHWACVVVVSLAA